MEDVMGMWTLFKEEPEVLLKAYYRDDDKVLRQINLEDKLSNLEDVFQDILKQLYIEKEVYYKPILIVIQGGKT